MEINNIYALKTNAVNKSVFICSASAGKRSQNVLK